MNPILEARSLRRTFKTNGTAVEALTGMNLSVAPGELVAIMGPSGSGKSTLLQLLGDLDRPTDGEVSLDGERVDTAARSAGYTRTNVSNSSSETSSPGTSNSSRTLVDASSPPAMRGPPLARSSGWRLYASPLRWSLPPGGVPPGGATGGCHRGVPPSSPNERAMG